MVSHWSAPAGVRSGAWWWCVALAGVLGGLPGAAPARAADEDARLKISYDPKAKPVEVKGTKGELWIRPNVEQPVFLFVRLPDAAEEACEVNVEVLVGNKPLEGASDSFTLKPGTEKQVDFRKKLPPTDKPAETKGKEPPPPPPVEIPGPSPYDFQIRLSQVKPQKKDLQTLTLKHIVSPLRYVNLASSRYDGKRQTLTVEVEAKKSFVGPACPIKLVLPPGRFLPPPRGKASDDIPELPLRRPGQSVPLSMESLRPRAGPNQDIDIFVSVDGIERAMIIRQRFAGQGGDGEQEDAPSVRLLAPLLLQGAKGLPIQFQVDYAPEQGQNMPPSDDVVLQFQVYKSNNPVAKPLFEDQFPAGPRFQKLMFSPQGKDGALVFKTMVQDWTIEQMETAAELKGYVGERYLVARLIDSKGKVIEFVNKRNQRVKLQDGRLVTFVKELPKLVVFDSATIKKGHFGQAAKLRVRAAYPSFRITKVLMFAGKAEGGKAPKDAEEASPLPDQEDIWEGALTLPAKSPAVINLVAEGNFVDGPTMTTIDTRKIILEAPPPPPPPAGTIMGKVTLGGDRIQPGEEVTLYKIGPDGKAAKAGTATTDDKGEYVFKGLAAGDYVVTSFKKQDPPAKDKKEVKVEVPKTVTVDLDLHY